MCCGPPWRGRAGLGRVEMETNPAVAILGLARAGGPRGADVGSWVLGALIID